MVDPKDPFQFHFIVDSGDTGSTQDAVNAQGIKLVNYFLAALTVPEGEMWVNLSPYEKNKVIPESFGRTEMGRDVLAQDYILKQLSASLTYPEEGLGKKFWDEVYAQVQKKYGAVNIPLNTFNKVWIMPAQAQVYEHNNGAFVVEAKLKVMLEQDYLAVMKNAQAGGTEAVSFARSERGTMALSPATPRGDGFREDKRNSSVTGPAYAAMKAVKEIVLPELEQQVNEGAHFAALRQAYSTMILASWYKIRLKESILGKLYVDQGKVNGIALNDNSDQQKIYTQYVEAFKKGVYNYIKESSDPAKAIPRKYFSGGVTVFDLTGKVQDSLEHQTPDMAMKAGIARGQVSMLTVTLKDSAMLTQPDSKVLPAASMYGPTQGLKTQLMMWHLKYKTTLSGSGDLSRQGFMDYLRQQGVDVEKEKQKDAKVFIDLLMRPIRELMRSKMRERAKEQTGVVIDLAQQQWVFKEDLRAYIFRYLRNDRDAYFFTDLINIWYKNSSDRVYINDFRRIAEAYFEQYAGVYQQHFDGFIDSLFADPAMKASRNLREDDLFRFDMTNDLRTLISAWHLKYKVARMSGDKVFPGTVGFLRFLDDRLHESGKDLRQLKRSDMEASLKEMFAPIEEFARKEFVRDFKAGRAAFEEKNMVVYARLRDVLPEIFQGNDRVGNLLSQQAEFMSRRELGKAPKGEERVNINELWAWLRQYYMETFSGSYEQSFSDFINGLMSMDNAMGTQISFYVFDAPSGDRSKEIYLAELEKLSGAQKADLNRLAALWRDRSFVDVTGQVNDYDGQGKAVVLYLQDKGEIMGILFAKQVDSLRWTVAVKLRRSVERNGGKPASAAMDQLLREQLDVFLDRAMATDETQRRWGGLAALNTRTPVMFTEIVISQLKGYAQRYRLFLLSHSDQKNSLDGIKAYIAGLVGAQWQEDMFQDHVQIVLDRLSPVAVSKPKVVSIRERPLPQISVDGDYLGTYLKDSFMGSNRFLYSIISAEAGVVAKANGGQVDLNTLSLKIRERLQAATYRDLFFASLDTLLNAEIKDFAMNGKELNSQPNDLGGIDLNDRNLSLLIKRDPHGIVLPVSAQDLSQVHFDGLFPLILNVSAVSNLNDLLN